MFRSVMMMLGLTMIAACSPAPGWSERTLRVAVDAPNPCWGIAIREIYRDADGLLAVSRLEPPPPGRMCAQVITTVSHDVTLPLPEGSVTHLVLGKTWNWGPAGPGYEFLDGRPALKERLAGAESLHEVAEGEGRKSAGGRVE